MPRATPPSSTGSTQSWRPSMSPRRIPVDTTVTAPRPGATHRVHLQADGVSVVLDVTDGRLPAVVHWGAPLGDLGPAGLDAVCEAAVDAVPHNAVDVPVRIGLLPQQSDGRIGRPGLRGGRPQTASHTGTGTATVRTALADQEQGLAVDLEVQLLPTGLLRLRASLTNTAAAPYALEELTLALPVPDEADELLDLAGRWA